MRRDPAEFFAKRIEYLCTVGREVVTKELVSSNWLLGYLRELVVRELLAPLIPHTCRLATGTVVDATLQKRRIHCQDDILIVDGECLPPFFEVMDSGMYPVESVLARIEVKTRLDSREVSRATQAAQEFWNLEPTLGSGSPGDALPVQVLFAFDESEGCEKELKEKLDPLMDQQSFARFILCVPGKRLWAYAHPYDDGRTTWYMCPEDRPSRSGSEEVLSLLALLLQELPLLRERGVALGRYIRCLREHLLVERDKV